MKFLLFEQISIYCHTVCMRCVLKFSIFHMQWDSCYSSKYQSNLCILICILSLTFSLWSIVSGQILFTLQNLHSLTTLYLFANKYLFVSFCQYIYRVTKKCREPSQESPSRSTTCRIPHVRELPKGTQVLVRTHWCHPIGHPTCPKCRSTPPSRVHASSRRVGSWSVANT